MIKLCDRHQVVYDSVKWLRCPVCEDYKEIDRHERENERLRIALETALKHDPARRMSHEATPLGYKLGRAYSAELDGMGGRADA